MKKKESKEISKKVNKKHSRIVIDFIILAFFLHYFSFITIEPGGLLRAFVTTVVFLYDGTFAISLLIMSIVAYRCDKNPFSVTIVILSIVRVLIDCLGLIKIFFRI